MTYELRKTDENVLIAEGASVTGDVRLAKGVSIWYGAVLRGDMGPITVGADTNIQDGAIFHEETVVGRGCTIGHWGHRPRLHSGGQHPDRHGGHRARRCCG